jgi:AcrR family transcriptional regulator
MATTGSRRSAHVVEAAQATGGQVSAGQVTAGQVTGGQATGGQATGDHRQRVLAGLAAALRERSYWEITVADVVRRARTSRRTFYEHFADKQDCLIALLQDETDQTVARIAAAVNPHLPWQAQVRQAVEAWIGGVHDDPGVRLCWIRVVPSLGDAARPLLRRTMDAFADLIRALAERPEMVSAGVIALAPQETVMLLGGLKELIATTVEDGDDVLSVIDIATEVTVRILAPHAEPIAARPAS